jgi:hypothetical protein
MSTDSICIVDPQILLSLQRTGTPWERKLSQNVQTLVGQVSAAHILIGKMRHLVGLATRIVSPADDISQEATNQAIDTFIGIAMEISTDKSISKAHAEWARARLAAEFAANGGRTREYYVELGREIIGLPPKDSAARELVKMDLDRALRAEQAVIEDCLLDKPDPSHVFHTVAGSTTTTACTGCGIDPTDERANDPCSPTKESS